MTSDDPAALVRVVAQWLMHDEEAISLVEDAALWGVGAELRANPVMAREVCESTRLNVRHWASLMADDPHQQVTPSLAGPVVGIAREVIRRDSEGSLASAYHVAKDEAWRLWMQRSFETGADAQTLSAALDLAFESLSSWIEATLSQLGALIRQERQDLQWQTHTQRLAMATKVLDEDPPDIDAAERGLGYKLRGAHLAGVLWTDASTPDQAALRRAANTLRTRADAPRMLAVPASASSLWLWIGSAKPIDPRILAEATTDRTMGLAVGGPGIGVDGFRSSHFEAVSAQRLLLRSAGRQFATFDDIALVHIATQNEQAAHAYVSRVLGQLLSADRDLLDTVRTYVREGHSVARTAQAVFAHRNTVLSRLKRAEQLLPQRYAANSLDVGVALEIDHWIGQH
ncbi:hypothetical protein G6027_17290 [Dietzia sp. SLG310A2-38A2]|uniref:PucR family transcriptional regulator n=1 Tax=Dietzia sp. SLG310A2-38A2 TaxID=1630643 RepID=UPI0015FA72C1|nr:helix-turn-helix domain-containing protein [Dietzia sp. SLG310A2-38A2]MBB1032594.1 hypothetical protein [Dietzia sp. SLG310A2-38A2]